MLEPSIGTLGPVIRERIESAVVREFRDYWGCIHPVVAGSILRSSAPNLHPEVRFWSTFPGVYVPSRWQQRFVRKPAFTPKSAKCGGKQGGSQPFPNGFAPNLLEVGMGVVYTLGMELARFQEVSNLPKPEFTPKVRNSPLWVPSRVL